MPEITIREINGRVVVDTPFGRLGFFDADAGRFAYDLAEQERYSVSKEAGDPARQRVVTYPCAVLDPVTELGVNVSETMEGSRARSSSAGGVPAPPATTGEDRR